MSEDKHLSQKEIDDIADKAYRTIKENINKNNRENSQEEFLEEMDEYITSDEFCKMFINSLIKNDLL